MVQNLESPGLSMIVDSTEVSPGDLVQIKVKHELNVSSFFGYRGMWHRLHTKKETI